MTDRLEIKQIKSVAGANQNQRNNLKALGLRRREHTVVHDDTATIRGMIRRVAHMVSIKRRQG
jgi:large subunit ribosomal protein L30